MKKFSLGTLGAVLSVFALAALPLSAQAYVANPGTAGGSMFTTATALRPSDILTTADVVTTFALPLDVKAVVYTVTFTKGSATSATFAPVGAAVPAWRAANTIPGTSYFKVKGAAVTVTADDRFVIRCDRELFGAWGYAGICTTGVGTMTSSDAVIDYRFEY